MSQEIPFTVCCNPHYSIFVEDPWLGLSQPPSEQDLVVLHNRVAVLKNLLAGKHDCHTPTDHHYHIHKMTFALQQLISYDLSIDIDEISKEELIEKLEEAQEAARKLLIGILAEMRFPRIQTPVLNCTIPDLVHFGEMFLKSESYAAGIPGRAEQAKEYWEKEYPFLKTRLTGVEPI